MSWVPAQVRRRIGTERAGGRSSRELTAALLVFSLLGVALLAGAFRDFGNHGAKDWEPFVGHAQAHLTTLRDHGQLPLWNPWLGGGQPSLAQPVSMLVSPVTVLSFLVGVLSAFKLMLVPLFVTGCLGMWALAGHLGLMGAARTVPALVYFGSSIFPLYVCGGLPNWLFGMALLPWLLLFHRLAIADRRFLVLTGLAYAGLLFCGAVDRFLLLPVLLGLDALCLAFGRRSLRPILTLGASLTLGLCLAAIRVLPLLEVYLQYPRTVEAATRYVPPKLLPRLFLGTDLPDLIPLGVAFVRIGDNLTYWINAGSYVGPVAVGLAAAGALFGWRKTWSFTLLGLVFTWLSFGTSVRPSLWRLLNQVPVLGSLRDPERMIFLVTLCLALLAGFGFRALQQALERRWPGRVRPRQAAVLVVLGAMTLPMIVVNAPISRTAFTVPPPHGLVDGGWFAPRVPRPPFRQGWFQRHLLQWGAPVWEPVLRNEGNVMAYTNIPIPLAARPWKGRRYRGEIYLQDGKGQILETEITPNVIRVQAELSEADQLVVNQNFYPGWRAAGTETGPPVSLEGLLSLSLPPGRHDVTLSFRPKSVRVGGVVTLASGALCVALLLGARRARLEGGILP